MWEAIASNRRRSLWLISLMGVLLVIMGAVIGATVVASFQGYAAHQRSPDEPLSVGDLLLESQQGVYFGMAAALLVWLIMWATAVGAGESLLLRSAQAREIRKEDSPQLWNVVEEMTIASGAAKMPRVFIIDDAGLNAFAVGHNPDKAAVAVTAGLLKRLSRDELQGVIAHEIGHIRNLDVRFMTLAGVMVGAIVLMSQIFLRGMFYGSVGRRRSSRGGGQAQIILLVISILVAVLAPLAAQLLYFSCSRRREFLADASAARFTRYPEGLASALEKISKKCAVGKETNKVVAPMYIINPLQARSAVGLLSTHPRTEDRIRILRSMPGAGFAAYEAAYKQARAGKGHCLGEKTLAAADEVGIREPTPQPKGKQQAIERAKQVGELLDHVLDFVVIPCLCGVKLKLPAGFKRDSLGCPRCGREHTVPKAQAVPRPPGAPASSQAMRYQRKGSGWESFQCGNCGQPVQLSPSFTARRTTCNKCRRPIEVIPAAE